MIDETTTTTTTTTTTNSIQTQIDNHLALIQSDELRDKLTEFNDKLKEANAASANEEIVHSSNYLHIMFKEILHLIHGDPEFSPNNYNSSLSDVALIICLMLKNEFTNHMLPAQFYALPNSGLI